MFRQTLNLTWHRDFITDLLNAIATAAPIAELLDGCEIHLYTNAFTPNADMVPADFTEADFTGSAEITPTFAAIGNTDTGREISAQAVWTATGFPTGGNTIEGYYVMNAGETDVICAERFSDPVPIANVGDQLTLEFIIEAAFVWPATEL